MRAFALHAADLLQATRITGRRFRRQPLALPWFLMLLLGSLWLLLKTAELAATGTVDTGLALSPGSLLFSAFLLSLGKGAVDGYYRLVRHPPLVFALAQPVSRARLLGAKMATVFSVNLGFLALALGTATALLLALHMDVPAGGPFVPALVAAVIGGLGSGVAFSVAASLSTWRRKGAALALLAGFPAIAWIALIQTDPGLTAQLGVLALLAVLAPAAALASSPWLVEAWNAQAASRPGVVRLAGSYRLPTMTVAEAAVFTKEVKTAWRKRETALALATLAFLGIALVAVKFLMGELPSSRFARAILPTMTLAGVFAGAAVTLTVRGLATLGGEHESLWILRTSPVRGREVLLGKLAAHGVVIPAIVAASLPLPLVAGFPWDTTLLVATASVAVSFLALAIGVYFGARSPNFDRSTGGLPDSFAMYGVFILALIACVVFVAPAGAVFASDRFLGILGMVLAADLALLVVYGVHRVSGPRLDALEI